MRITLKNTIAVALIVLAVATGSYAQGNKLPVVKEGLLNELRRPDFKPSAMIKFITSNGVNFVVTPDVEAQLKSAGATPAIIKAAKENYRLPGGKRASFLNVAANVADAEFIVDGVGGAFTGAISDHPLAPGTYRITAKRAGYIPETQTAQIRQPGKSVSVSFTLKPVPVSSLLDDAKTALERKDHRSAEALSRQVLDREPANATAHMLLGKSLYMKGDVVQGADHVIKGLQGGDSITFAVGRRKVKTSVGGSLDPGSLILKQSKIAFVNNTLGEPLPAAASGETVEFEVPYAKVLSLQTDKKDGDWRISMKVAVPRSNGKEDKKDFNFYTLRPDSKTPTGAVCIDCERESKFITDLISNMKRDGIAPKKKT